MIKLNQRQEKKIKREIKLKVENYEKKVKNRGKKSM